MKIVYRLRNNLRYIKAIQEASLHSSGDGLKITHGLLGTDEWWAHIRDGSLPTVTIRGVVSSVYMSGHNDYPEFEITAESGEKSRWTRECVRGWDVEYQQWRSVELDYVVQKFKRPILGTDSKIVLEIRLGNKRDPNKELEATPVAAS
jgi:hypothetical protein